MSTITAQKMKFSIKDFFSKCDQICSFLGIWPHLLKKSLMKNIIFVQCIMAPMCHKFLPHFELFHESFDIISYIF